MLIDKEVRLPGQDGDFCWRCRDCIYYNIRNNENIFDYDDLLTEWFGARDDTDSDEPSSDNDSDDGKLLF